jgi:uncharacterized protein
MADPPFVTVKEIILKTENESGRIIILRPEKGGDGTLTMFVGEGEFLAIAKEKKLVRTPRPLTHELYLGLLEETALQFLRVEIYDLRDQAFLARVIYQFAGEERAMEARPSDVLALALNRNLPILVHPKLFKRELNPQQMEAFKDLIKTVKF